MQQHFKTAAVAAVLGLVPVVAVLVASRSDHDLFRAAWCLHLLYGLPLALACGACAASLDEIRIGADLPAAQQTAECHVKGSLREIARIGKARRTGPQSTVAARAGHRKQNSVAGSMVSTAVPKIAAIWLRMKDEINNPIAVAHMT